MKYKIIPILTDKQKIRFENKILYKSPNGCHYWTGFIDNMGYGCVQINAIRYKSSRVSYTLHKGNIPNGMNVCHKCDNILCVNPDHLFLGTQKDNIQDMLKKGRNNHPKGSRCGLSKLNEKDVIKIKKRLNVGESITSIANGLGVVYNTIEDIKKNVTWKHVK